APLGAFGTKLAKLASVAEHGRFAGQSGRLSNAPSGMLKPPSGKLKPPSPKMFPKPPSPKTLPMSSGPVLHSPDGTPLEHSWNPPSPVDVVHGTPARLEPGTVMHWDWPPLPASRLLFPVPASWPPPG